MTKFSKLILLVCVLSALVLLPAGCAAPQDTVGITVNGILCTPDTSRLDLSGTENPELSRIPELTNLRLLDLRRTGVTPEDVSRLRDALPECRILWSIPLSSGTWDSDAVSLHLPTLAPEDISLLDCFPNLTGLDVDTCPDLDSILLLKQQNPDLTVTYPVTLGGAAVSCDTAALTLETVTAAELEAVLPHLTALKHVTLSAPEQDTEGLLALMQAFPGLSISWEMDLCGIPVNSLAEEVDISGTKVVDLSALENLVSRMPNLKKVIMSGCGIPNGEMEALNHRHRDILFVWSVAIGPNLMLPTDTTAFVPHQHGVYWVSNEYLANLRYCTEMVCLDLGHQDITRCDFLAYMPKLKYLVLADTPIRDISPITGCKELIFLELFLSDVSDYTPLLELTNLQDLNLCYTHGSMEVIRQMTWLKRLWWYPEEDKLPTLEEALPNTGVNVSTVSSTGGTWREGQNYYDMRDLLGLPYMVG